MVNYRRDEWVTLRSAAGVPQSIGSSRCFTNDAVRMRMLSMLVCGQGQKEGIRVVEVDESPREVA